MKMWFGILALCLSVASSSPSLHALIQQGLASEVRNVLQDVVLAVDEADSNGFTPLLLACMLGQNPVVHALLQAGADPESATGLRTPLLVATRLGRAASVRMLLRAGADPNKVDAHGQTALMAAASVGRLPIMQSLLEANASLEARTAQGWTALMLAAMHGQPLASRLLANAGADLGALDDKNVTAIGHASVEGNTEVVKELLRAGSSVSGSGRPPLVLAAERDHVGVIVVLIRAGFSVHRTDIWSLYTPLTAAATHGNEESLRWAASATRCELHHT